MMKIYAFKRSRDKLKNLKFFFLAVISITLINTVVFFPFFKGPRTLSFDVPCASTAAETNLEGLSGKVFEGDVIRDFTGSLIFDPTKTRDPEEQKTGETLKAVLTKVGDSPKCRKWSVVTTIFEPSDSVKKQAELGPDWCMVIVGDKKGPREYSVFDDHSDSKVKNVVYLNVEMQKEMAETSGSTFLNIIPWNHFGRKNIGFLYAIANGAELIWDFDDDNALIDVSGGDIVSPCSLDSSTDANEVQVVTVPPKTSDCLSFNPYPVMGANTTLPAWPRGIPLPDILDDGCVTASKGASLVQTTVPKSSLGVCQSLAQHDPDVDSIYRLTRGTPFYYSNGIKDPVLIPIHAMTPFNAQATMFTRRALWCLLLPITVHGRVTDIWRSYFMQRLMREIGQRVVFVDSLVVQHRNVHNYLADFDSEKPLFEQSGALIDFLQSWEVPSYTDSLSLAIEALYVELFRRGYVEVEDVKLMQEWLLALEEIGYVLPKRQNLRGEGEEQESNAISVKGRQI